ncbi:MAG TPA: glycosyltransferase [Candidatus Saccharimonadales bacterium]|nr:glycosyltransferase [Candidatus Saccharimonadales bacterium]
MHFVIEKLAHLIYLLPIIIPLGFIGIWRWSVWLFKEVCAFFYRPTKSQYTDTVSLITPVYNEKPEVFLEALRSWANEQPDEIIAVIDHSDSACIDTFKSFQKEFKNSILIVTDEPGKRPALAKGIKIAKSKIVALVDCDTIWTKGVLKNSLKPFAASKIGGVATRQNVVQVESLAQKLFDIQLDLRFSDELAFLDTTSNTLTCLSGRTAFYRKDIILPLLNEFVNETFLGQKVISGEDKRLTYLIQERGWKTAYQSSAQVLTYGTTDLKSFLNQRIRWGRNSWRADIRAIGQGWPFKKPLFAFFLLDRFIQPFTLLLGFFLLILTLLHGLWLSTLAIIWWLLISRTIKLIPHFKRAPRDILFLPSYIVLSYFLGVLKIYSLVTLNTQGWITRWDKSRLGSIKLWTRLTSYITTALILCLIAASSEVVYTFTQKIKTVNALGNGSIISNKPISLKSTESSFENLSGTSTPAIKRYTVKAGEYLAQIAADNNIDVDQLLNYNFTVLANWNRIEEGDVLSIPTKSLNFQPERLYNYQRNLLPPLEILYDQSTNSISLAGRGVKINFKDLADAQNTYIKETSPGVFYITANIVVGNGVTLNVGDDSVKELRLKSDKTGYVTITSFNGRIMFNGIKVTSWDESQNSPDKNISDGRSYILVRGNTIMDINNSDFSYLGFKPANTSEGGTYGVSWRIPSHTFGKYLATGQIINSKFHNNYFGAYTFGATGMLWKNNEFYQNTRYGLDPHDDSNNFLVENNKFYDNGTHGLIFSKRCFGNVIINNISFNNKLHGIMLHARSDKNIVENNIVYGNHDGIAIYNSSNNTIKNNDVYQNNTGVRINEGSNENVVIDNSITKSQIQAVHVYSNSNNNYFIKNSLSFNDSGFSIATNSNEIYKNKIENNKVGLYLIDTATQNKISDNDIKSNWLTAFYWKTEKGTTNYIFNNVQFDKKILGFL